MLAGFSTMASAMMGGEVRLWRGGGGVLYVLCGRVDRHSGFEVQGWVVVAVVLSWMVKTAGRTRSSRRHHD